MAYWLMKSEPDSWSWHSQLQKGVEGWNGVRNYQAANNMKAMRLGDLAFFYHSNVGREIVGIVEIVREAYPDESDATGRFVMVDVKAVETLRQPVSLEAIKAESELQSMALLRQSRLSVQPVESREWRLICRLGGVAPDGIDEGVRTP
jgi:predicted RNA-binding protein with PUA-like domain